MSGQTLSAYVLHSRAYRDTSVIADLYSLEQGRVSAVFKGVRSVGKKRGVVLEPFSRLSVNLTGKGPLKNGRAIEAQRQFRLASRNALYSGMYINELLVRLVHEGEANIELFAAYEWVLSKLSGASAVADYLRAFEYRLLQCLGYPIGFENDATGAAITGDCVYRFDTDMGFTPVNKISDNQRFFSGQMLMDIAALAWHDASRQAAKAINRQALTPLLGDKPLASRELFRMSQ